MRLDSIEAAGYTIALDGDPSQFRLEVQVSSAAEGITDVHLHFSAEHPLQPTPLVLSWVHPMIATDLKWHPGAHLNRIIEPNWNPGAFVSRGTTNAPVYALYSLKGTNALTFALSDALNAIRLSVGLVEETALAQCQVTLFRESQAALQDYHVTLRLDRRALPYEQILAEISAWWAATPDYTPAPAPELACVPLYSTWYSFHQNLTAEDVEAQCRLAKSLGMDVVIVDDGWQTDDNQRGYAFCGDWEVTPRKFPDFRAHVARVHEIGLSYLLWFSVPFLGRNTNAFEHFHDKVLDPDSNRGWHVLDPRFPDVRDYLIGIYRRFVIDYDIDGFKLDFVDSFCQTRTAQVQSGGGRDYDSVSEAVDRLLTDVIDELRKLKPDILIEFRQTYIGPMMRKYGNMLRAGDAPNTLTDNQVRILDVRLLAGTTPVHADMLMWHPEESVEGAAMQVIHALFGVPQISVRLDQLPQAHVEMLRFYLDFWRKYQQVLRGKLHPQQPGYLYPLVIAETPDQCLVAFYGTTAVRLDEIRETLILVNGTFETKMLLDLGCDFGRRTIAVQTCCGEILSSKQVELPSGVHSLTIPPGGMATISLL